MTTESNHRRYGDRELNAIIRRAVELQHATQKREDDTLSGAAGVSLEQLQGLAAEAGIDPEYVARAAAELEAGTETPARHFWGGPASFTLDRTLEGELPQAAWDELLTEVADSLNGSTSPSRVGDLLEGQDASTRVRIRSDQGRTRIAVRSKYGEVMPGVPITVLSLAFLAAMGVMAKGPFPDTIAPLVGAAVLAAGFLSSRAIVSHYYRKSRQEMSGLLNRLTRKVTPLLSARSVTERPVIHTPVTEEESQTLQARSR